VRAVPERLIERLEELEIRVAFQEDLLGTLDRGVTDLSQSMGHLRDELGQLRLALDAVRVALGHDVRDEAPPPHY
jgi:SlyX protein